MKLMKTLVFLIVAIVVFTVTGCKPSREKSVTEIKNMEKHLFSPDAVSFDKVKADSLINLYTDFIKRHSSDSLTPGYIFKAASLAMNTGDGNKAISLFDQYMNDYPDGNKAALCMFFKGYIYENMLRNLEKAKETYLQFIERYPENDFVKDAQMAIQNLGKTPEQIVRELEAKKQADSVQMADAQAKSKKLKPKGK